MRTTRGNITVFAEDAAEIHLTARKTAHADSEQEAHSSADNVHVTVTPTDAGFTIEPQGMNGTNGPVYVDLEVHVPKGSSLYLESDRGNIQVSGINGSISIVGRGDIEARQSGGDVSVDERQGDVRVLGAAGNVRISGKGDQVELSDIQGATTLEGEFSGPLRFARLTKGIHFVSQRSDLTVTQLSGRIEGAGPGDLEIHDAAGNVTLTTTKKDVVLDNVTGRIQVENRGGNVTLRFAQPPKEEIDVSNRTGDIDLTLPSKSIFDLNARADRGEIECSFSELESRIEKLRNDAALDGSVGSHGPKLQLHTTYGTIRLRKGQ